MAKKATNKTRIIRIEVTTETTTTTTITAKTGKITIRNLFNIRDN